MYIIIEVCLDLGLHGGASWLTFMTISDIHVGLYKPCFRWCDYNRSKWCTIKERKHPDNSQRRRPVLHDCLVRKKYLLPENNTSRHRSEGAMAGAMQPWLCALLVATAVSAALWPGISAQSESKFFFCQ